MAGAGGAGVYWLVTLNDLQRATEGCVHDFSEKQDAEGERLGGLGWSSVDR